MNPRAVKPSFSSGELSPALYSRVDMQQYQLGARTMRNFVVRPYGGASTRPCTEFIFEALGPTRLIPFQFNVTQNYMLAFSEKRLRVYTSDGLIVTDPAADSDLVWRNPSGDIYYLDGSTFVDPGIYEPQTVWSSDVELTLGDVTSLNEGEWAWGDNNSLGYDTLYVRLAAGTANVEVPFTIGTPYSYADLALLKYTQDADALYLTHPDYKMRKLTRLANDDWTFRTIDFSIKINPPTGVTASFSEGSKDGSRTVQYAVSSIGADDEESTPSEPFDFDVGSIWIAGNIVQVGWTADADAVAYNVYKSERGQFGLIGTVDKSKARETATTTFDNGGSNPSNVIDGDRSSRWQGPSSGSSADGTDYIGIDLGSAQIVKKLRVLQGKGSSIAGVGPADYKVQYSTVGTGGPWTDVTTVQVTDPDENENYWQEIPIDSVTARWWRLLCDSAPYVQRRRRYGSNSEKWAVYEFEAYTEGIPVSFEDDNIIPDVAVGPKESRDPFNSANPGSVGIFQQRLLAARTDAQPQTLFASRTGDFNNMSISTPLLDDDAIEATISARQINEIRHIVPMRQLILMTSDAEWLVNSGRNDEPLTPRSVRFDIQGYYGCSDIEPIVIGNDVIFLQNSDKDIRNLFYQFEDDAYRGNHLSVLSEHLFKGRKVVSWAYQQEPNSVIWCVMDDGTLLGFTYLREHEVFAWHRHDCGESTDSLASFGVERANGWFRDVACIPGPTDTDTWLVVERYAWMTCVGTPTEAAGKMTVPALPGLGLSDVFKDGEDVYVTDSSYGAGFGGMVGEVIGTYEASSDTVVLNAKAATLFISEDGDFNLGRRYFGIERFSRDRTPEDDIRLSAFLDASTYAEFKYTDEAAQSGDNPSLITIQRDASYNFKFTTTAAGQTSGSFLLDDGSEAFFLDKYIFAAVYRGEEYYFRVDSTISSPTATEAWCRACDEDGVDLDSPSSIFVAMTVNQAYRLEAMYFAPDDMTGFERFIGREVYIQQGKYVLPANATVSGNGWVQFPGDRTDPLNNPAGANVPAYGKVRVGIRYTAELETLDLDVQSDKGSAQGRRKKLPKITMRLENSFGGEVGPDSSNTYPIREEKDASEDYHNDLFTGDKELAGNNWDKNGRVYVKAQYYPITVLGIIPEVVIGE